MTYLDTAYAAAKTQKLTADAVAELGYTGIAALCKVAIDKDGNSPADFFYLAVQQHLVSMLQREETAAANEAKRQAVAAALSAADVAAASVALNDAGEVVVK